MLAQTTLCSTSLAGCSLRGRSVSTDLRASNMICRLLTMAAITMAVLAIRRRVTW